MKGLMYVLSGTPLGTNPAAGNSSPRVATTAPFDAASVTPATTADEVMLPSAATV